MDDAAAPKVVPRVGCFSQALYQTWHRDGVGGGPHRDKSLVVALEGGRGINTVLGGVGGWEPSSMHR